MNLLTLLLVLVGQSVRWVETTHADFADGIVDPQMYVSLRSQLDPDSGCVEFFSRFDVNNDGWYDLGCSDDSGPNLTIYLGSPDGYSPENRLRYGPLGSGGNIDLADLNLDGHAELIHSGWRDGRAVVYWGTPSGPSAFDTTVLDYDGEGEDVSVYDLDKDAYLDILLGSSNGRLYVFWGSRGGYRTSNHSEVSLGRSLGHNIEVADLDRDGWGDIVLSSWTWNQNPIVYWGPNRQPRNIIWLPGRWNNFHGISVADLDKNGWLDIVYTGYDTVVTSFIYFGSDSGFAVDSRTEVHPGQCYGGSAIVDLNDDSWLDIVFLRGNWIHGGTWKPVVYYNTLRAPYFSDSSRVDLGTGTFNASGGFIGDFDRDDIPDVFVNNMIPRDSSFILWGPDYLRRTGLPSHMDHHGVFREPGNVYDRSLTAYYRSSVFDAGDTARCMSGACRWLAFEPPGSKVLVACRSGEVPVPDSTWTEFDWVDSVTGRIPDRCLGGRYLQYEVVFRYLWPCYLPNLERIELDLVVGPQPFADVGVTEIVVPGRLADSGVALVPAAVVYNFGTQPSNFTVRMSIGPDYADTVFATLVPGRFDTVFFASWTPTRRGIWPVKCSTALATDVNPENDAQMSWVTVRVEDVAAVRIIAPTGTMYEQDTVTPQAAVRNLGTTSASFPVEFRIGDGYLERAIVLDLLPDSEAIVSFRLYYAEPGSHPVSCSTALSGDMVPANDRVVDTVRVAARLVFDVGVSAILAPVDTVDSGMTVRPRAVVENFGTQAASFPVRCYVGESYSDQQFVWLDAGGQDTVEFIFWNALECGRFSVRCSTAYADDSNPANDQRLDTVVVVPAPVHDVAVTAIVAPAGTLDSGTVTVPRAVVRNLGNRAAVFPLRCYIGADYSDEQTVSLAACQSDTVAFRAWTALLRGDRAVRCTAAYLLDRNPANDKREQPVFVRVRDVAATAIIAPVGTVPAGVELAPRALVRNLGNVRESFAVLARITTDYVDTARVSALYPDSSTVVTLRPWRAVTGRHTVSCSTMLGPDMVRSNDRVQDTVCVTPSAQQDVGVVEILAPVPVADSGRVVLPSAVVANYGTAVASFAVRLTIGSSYLDEQIVSLAPQELDTVTFREWEAVGRGQRLVRCSTMMAGDSNPANDTLTRVIRIRVRDVGAVRIIAPPGQVRNGEVVTPQAEVQNFGTEVESFQAVFRIQGGYADTVRVSGLAPNSWSRIRFRSWPAVTGDYGMACSTCLSVDMRPDNDQVSGVVYVVQRALLVVPDTSAWAFPSTTVDYRLRVTNLSSEMDTIDLATTRPRSGWLLDLLDAAKAGPLPDRNNNGLPDIAGLWPGATEPFTVRVTVPADELALVEDSVVVTGRSSRDTTVTDQARLRTSVLTVASLNLSPDGCDSIPAGGSVDYRLTVANLGNAFDLADLELERISGQPGWFYQFLGLSGNRLSDGNHNGKPDIGPLAPFAGSDEFLLRVRAPTDARPGETDAVRVWALSGNNPATRTCITARTTALGRLTGLVVAPDQEDQQLTGTSSTYRLYVKTRGNMADIIGLRAIPDQPDWLVAVCDEQGRGRLPDPDLDGFAELGPVVPDTERYFTLLVRTPDNVPDDLAGNIDSLGCCRIQVIGRSTMFDGLGDTALVVIRAIPRLAIHNFQNPFRDRTRFIFSIPQPGRASLRVYNRAGELVSRVFELEEFAIGIHTRVWNGTNLSGRRLAPGTYLYVFELTDTPDDLDRRLTKKLMIE